MKRLCLVMVLLVLVVTAAQADFDRGLLRAMGIAAESKPSGLAMQPSNPLSFPTPELAGISPAAIGQPTILELKDGSAELPIIWRDSKGQVVKRPGEYVASAFSENGLECVQLAMRSADVLKVAPRRRCAEWMTVVVRLRDLPISWTVSAWVSWGDYRHAFRPLENWQHQGQENRNSVSSSNQNSPNPNININSSPNPAVNATAVNAAP